MYLLPLLLPIIIICLCGLTFRLYNLKLAFSFIFVSLSISLICCFYMFYEVIYLNSTCIITFAPWFQIGNILVNWSFYLIN